MYSKSYDHCQTSYLPSLKVIFILEYEPLNRRLTNLKYHLTSRYNYDTCKQTHLPYSMQKRCSKITYTLKMTHTLGPICILHFINCFCTFPRPKPTHNTKFVSQYAYSLQNSTLHTEISQIIIQAVFLPFSPTFTGLIPIFESSSG